MTQYLMLFDYLFLLNQPVNDYTWEFYWKQVRVMRKKYSNLTAILARAF